MGLRPGTPGQILMSATPPTAPRPSPETPSTAAELTHQVWNGPRPDRLATNPAQLAFSTAHEAIINGPSI